VGEAKVLVETVQLDPSASRQIGPRARTTDLLHNRREEIESAVAEASAIAQHAVSTSEDKNGWRVKKLDVQFGLTLAAEAGVIVSKASADASFQVTISIERG
jgi:hypothetical protein